MVDNLNPSNQFHPYQPQTATPHSEKMPSGLGGLLNKFGLNSGSVNARQSMDKFRGYAQKNPGAVLGGLAALVIGAGMLRGRR